jgi:gamma-glutamyltranspeptidase/glutathione hydrolase
MNGKQKWESHRPVVMGKHWMASTGHHLASLEAERVLRDGGNAVDAALAASAVLTVVRPHFCGLGGDLFAHIYLADSRKVEVLNACGASPFGAEPNKFPANGIPKKGFLAASVPGLVDGWEKLAGRYATRPLASLLKPAIELAEEGFPVYKNLAETLVECEKMLTQEGNRAKAFFKNGRPLMTGEFLIQSGLARSLREISQGGAESFYRGEGAKAVVRESQSRGGLFSDRDFLEHRSAWVEPIHCPFSGYEVYAVPPNSYGMLLLLQLAILDRFDLAKFGHNTADALHVQVESKKYALGSLARVIADPRYVKADLNLLLSKNIADKLAGQIDLKKAAFGVEAGNQSVRPGRDTTYLAVVDSSGNCVSMIQSLYHAFGSGVFIEDTGIVLNNRMIGFTLENEHPNQVAPHKRPAHTLSPALVLKDSKPAVVLGTPGGTGQTQSIAQILINLFEFGMDIQEAIEAPRWRSETETELAVEKRIPEVILNDLQQRGHNVKAIAPWSPSMGGAEGIVIQDNGVLLAGADPRRDGYAIGY